MNIPHKPLISLIAAMTPERVIGIDNRLPWHLPADLAHFRALTLGKPIVMGRLTYQSIGKPLPGRTNIVLTRDTNFTAVGCQIIHSLEALAVKYAHVPEIMIMGGSQVYQQALAFADKMYLTIVETNVTGDAFFPAWDDKEWQEISREAHDADDKNPYAYTFIELQRL